MSTDLADLTVPELEALHAAVARPKALQSEAVKDAAESIKEDNPEMDESTAFAIAQDMENQGMLAGADLSRAAKFALQDDPCWENYTMVGMKTDENGNEVPNCVPDDDVPDANLASACGEGQLRINDECVDVQEIADVPPGALDMGQPRVLSMRTLAGPIEREETNGGVVYRNLKILTRGVWTDQSSQTPTEYVPRNLEVEDGATVNVMHDDSEVSEAGEIVAGSDTVEDGALFADVRLNTDTAAGEYADQSLQAALESNGREGFGGPSVEIPPEGLVLEPDGPNGVPQTKDGRINGLGFVSQPAAKDTAFSQQTRERQVALGAGQTDKGVVQQRTLMDPEDLRETLAEYGVSGIADMTDDEVMDMAEALHDDLMAEIQEGEDMDNAEHGGDMDNEEEEDDKDMADDMAGLEDEIADLREELDELRGEMMTAADMQAAKEELAAADTVDEIDRRLSELEDQPKDPKTLADNDNDDGEDWSDADSGVGYNSASGTTY